MANLTFSVHMQPLLQKLLTVLLFLQTVQRITLWFLDEGLLTLPQWEHLGRDLARAEQQEPLPPGTVRIWTLIKSCLTDGTDKFRERIQEGEKVL